MGLMKRYTFIAFDGQKQEIDRTKYVHARNRTEAIGHIRYYLRMYKQIKSYSLKKNKEFDCNLFNVQK